MIRSNPTTRIESPKYKPSEIRPLDSIQIAALLEAAKTDRLYALYVLAIYTGMRQGELLGLQWKDVDLTNGRIHVKHNLIDLGKNLTLSEPKTKSSKRTIRMMPQVAAALKAHKATMLAEGHRASAYVFCGQTGNPIWKRSLIVYSYEPILERAKLDGLKIRFHDLRHTCATLWLRAGVHPKIVQALLGHSTISQTLDTYSHVLPVMHDEALDRVSAYIQTSVKLATK